MFLIKAIDTAQFVTTLYTWSAFNTEDIGKLVGQALAKLVENYPTNKIHLIGMVLHYLKKIIT